MTESKVHTWEAFLDSRQQANEGFGFEPVWMPDFLFPFQVDLVRWAIEQGRAAIFGDCGLGKTPMQLVWAENVVRKTNRPVLILTPLAVSAQTIREAEKFGIETTRTTGAIGSGIHVTNYEQLHHFDPADFSGVVCDESSILKSFNGTRRKEITDFMRKMKYRLLCTATAAPNDYIELGTSSEALGYLGHMDMLKMFFRNVQNTNAVGGGGRTRWSGGYGTKWRFKGHAEDHFWKWVCSWARAVRKPSDLGYDDERFTLPPLTESEHMVEARTVREGFLFDLPATSLQEQREEQRRTITERCEKVAELVEHDRPALVWCHLNDEGDLLEKLIPGSVQVAGKHSDEKKETRLTDFALGKTRVLITKPKIGAWGLNFQHCNHITFFPSHSFEQYYQGVRRCWRFGQEKPVHVDIIATEGGMGVLKNLQRKAVQAGVMFDRLVEHMNDAVDIRNSDTFTKTTEVPSWLTSN